MAYVWNLKRVHDELHRFQRGPCEETSLKRFPTQVVLDSGTVTGSILIAELRFLD